MYRKNNDIICIRETHRPAMEMLFVSEGLLDNWLELLSVCTKVERGRYKKNVNLPLP